MLVTLSANSNQLTTLDLSHQASLGTLYLNSNPLTSLDLQGCDVLATLQLNSCQLTSIDLLTAPDVTSLSIMNGVLTVDAVNHILAALVTSGKYGGSCDISNNTPNAPPSTGPPNGIAAKANLNNETPPWTVNTDVIP